MSQLVAVAVAVGVDVRAGRPCSAPCRSRVRRWARRRSRARRRRWRRCRSGTSAAAGRWGRTSPTIASNSASVRVSNPATRASASGSTLPSSQGRMTLSPITTSATAARISVILARSTFVASWMSRSSSPVDVEVVAGERVQEQHGHVGVVVVGGERGCRDGRRPGRRAARRAWPPAGRPRRARRRPLRPASRSGRQRQRGGVVLHQHHRLGGGPRSAAAANSGLATTSSARSGST